MAKGTRLTNAAYDEFKSFLFITAPFFSCVCFGLSLILNDFKYLMGVTSFISLFVGICLSVSTKRYRESDAAYDGHLFVDTSDEATKKFTLELNEDPDDFTKKESIIFKVIPSKE